MSECPDQEKCEKIEIHDEETNLKLAIVCTVCSSGYFRPQ